ncbi:hypothetical protein [Alteromonas sp. RKMC-009]|uniref:hypothetical protein n=1 Tax=Alteromonas sp. RKMC-009 TaxID=2267264 RepID=UPI000E698973|nr:hypothetical protein [Alteromonas sp. RKMC-009]AYA64339.1 hypothetical protein DS731_10195 [Alteromonas sp. RKMC-009]
MSLKNALKTKKDINLDSDRVGGRRMLETDAYPMKIKYAFLDAAKSGAISLNFQLESEAGSVTQTTYLTSGEEKGLSNTYTDKEGNEQYLPGFILGNTMTLLSVGEEIGDLDTEEKVINLYDFDAKKELPTKVQMLVDLLDKEIIAAVELQEVDKRVKNDQGKYVASGETRQQNEVVKFFRASDKMTVTEIQSEAEEATFIDVWTEKNKGQVINRAKGASGNGATKGAPPKSGGDKARSGVKSLFK